MKNSPDASEPLYTLKEWTEDFQYWMQKSVDCGERNQPMKQSDVDSYFSQRYGADRYRQPRMMAALSYLDRHLDDFNDGSIAIAASQQVAVGTPMMLALYRAYCNCPDNMILHDFPTSLILKMAREHAQS